MLIKFGAIVTRGSGKLGGHVFSTNRGGAYIRTNQTPSNPQTPFQQSGRAIFTELTQGWSGLTQDQRNTWSNATSSFPVTDRFGDSRELSGKGLYISLNKERKLINLPFLENAPSPAPISVPDSIIFLFETSSSDLGLDVDTLPADTNVVLSSTGEVSQGTSFVKNKLRVFQVYNTSTLPTASALFAAYAFRFGTPQVGSKIFISAYTINASGQRSPAISTFGITE